MDIAGILQDGCNLFKTFVFLNYYLSKTVRESNLTFLQIDERKTQVHSAQSQTAALESIEADSREGDKNALYEGAQLWRSDLRSAADIVLVKRLMDNDDISMWKLHPKQAEYLVKSEKKLYIHRQLRAKGLNHSVLIMDVQRRIDSQSMKQDTWDKNSLRRGHRMNWNKYPTLEIINEYTDFLVKNYPSICKKEVIGKSHENRSITMIKISNGNPMNKGILLNAGVHAREWLGISSTLVIMREIVTKYDEQPSYVKDKNWYIIPVLNTDGFVYSHNKDRLWRKNRRKVNDQCFGVDLNRNFNSTWFISGISETNPCKNGYIGPRPFSEPETLAFQNNVMKLIKKQLIASMDLHNYGQLVLHPWSSKAETTTHKDIQSATAAGMSKAIQQRSKKKYRHGHTYHVIYPATGSILDWAYESGVVHSYVIEGPDTGTHGFLVQPTEIENAGMDMFAAIKHLANVISSGKNRAGQDYPWF